MGNITAESRGGSKCNILTTSDCMGFHLVVLLGFSISNAFLGAFLFYNGVAYLCDAIIVGLCNWFSPPCPVVYL